MKTLFYFFLFPVILISNTSLSQTSQVPDIGAIWVEANKGMASMSLPVITSVESDTTIGDYNYKKIGSGYFRDSLNVWFVIAEGDSVEHMYYDFTVQLGDTVHPVNPMIDEEDRAPYLEVTSVDSLQLLDGTWKRAISLYYESANGSEGSFSRWVEDLGSTTGILKNARVVGIDGGWTDLVCFTDAGGQTLYEEPVQEDYGYVEFVYEDCYWTVGIAELSEIDLSIYPIPADQNISVEFENFSSVRSMAISIFDLQGRELKNEIITQDKNSFLIDSSGLPNGTYLLKLTTDTFQKTQKIVIQH